MKARLSLIFAALVVLLGSMVWIVNDRNRSEGPVLAAAPVQSGVVVQPAMSEPAKAVGRTSPTPSILPAVATAPLLPPEPSQTTPPMVHVDASGNLAYKALYGDTVSQLAIALFGTDSKANRAAVILANPSLMDNPDRVLEGQVYVITEASHPAKNPEVGVASATSAGSKQISASPTTAPSMSYTAQPGDSVSVLAGNLLGGDTRENREAIIADNAALQNDPDHLVAGQRYTINAPNGLASNPAAPQAKSDNGQPDADEIAQKSVARTLRYTAQGGDTVSKLALVLLGSDTPANQLLIVQCNPSLKLNPDYLVAGQTYWITAPTAAAAK